MDGLNRIPFGYDGIVITVIVTGAIDPDFVRHSGREMQVRRIRDAHMIGSAGEVEGVPDEYRRNSGGIFHEAVISADTVFGTGFGAPGADQTRWRRGASGRSFAGRASIKDAGYFSGGQSAIVQTKVIDFSDKKSFSLS